MLGNGREDARTKADDRAMQVAYVSALSALAGAAIGGLTSFASTWATQRAQLRTQLLEWDRSRRTTLYVQFIEEASKLYADALEHDKAESSRFVDMFTLISRMRILSAQGVIENAEIIVQRIGETYRAPNRNFDELLDMVILGSGSKKDNGTVDLLRDFSEACREEARMLGYL
jgi:hypothetical protein